MIRSEALDIVLESRGSVIWFFLSGHFNNEQAPSISEKFTGLMADGCRSFIVDMEKVTAVDDAVVPMFLNLLNTLRGKGGDLKLIFRNDVMYRAFLPFTNLFTIYPDAEALTKGTLLGLLQKRSKTLSKKTGFRISRTVAIIMLIVLCGWFMTLLYIINMQNERIRVQQDDLHELNLWKHKAEIEVEALRERLQPLEQLGIVKKDEPKKQN
ncbi:MAG: STAS domain-containing protein [Chitinispirillia bacterium]|nr:STAS domain-containing protein [Chitinispirillia bacterium]MCL2242391.1 STAS domain-containing protein [Chitinispirillia bacterium]